MSRGKRNRPLRTGVKRRQRERNFEAVVRFRPPPPLIATSFLDDVSDISDLEVEDMPGAQAEEPPADEERSWQM